MAATIAYVEPAERHRGTSSRKLTAYGLHDAPNWRSVGAAFIALDGVYGSRRASIETGRALGSGDARLHIGDSSVTLAGDALYGLRGSQRAAPPVRRKRASKRWSSNAKRGAKAAKCYLSPA